MIDVEKIRKDFPILESTNSDGVPLIYADSACMSLKPEPVVKAILHYYRELASCGGRSPHHLGLQVTEEFELARERLAQFINASHPSEVIWTKNTTEAINLVAQSFQFEEGDAVVIEDVAHNSNLVPWKTIADQRKLELRILTIPEDGEFPFDQLDTFLDSSLKMVAISQTSNVTGACSPIEEISKRVHETEAKLCIDAAQGFPHCVTDVQKWDADFIAASMHKALGPTGVGFLYGKKSELESLGTFLVGGETVADVHVNSVEFAKPPHRFEAGLQHYAGVIGSGAAIEYLQSVGMEAIHEYEVQMAKVLLDRLAELNLPENSILGPIDPTKRTALASIQVPGLDPHEIALILDDEYNIALRAGYHCAHAWHHRLGSETGTLRPSFYLYNTIEEIERLVTAIGEVIAMFS